MQADLIIKDALYLLAILNPASKVVLLATVEPRLSFKGLAKISLKSSLVALIMLLITTTAGQELFKHVLHVELYSLQIAGGVVLFVIGLVAIREGVFFQAEKAEGMIKEDFSIVPLASPFIAGPGMVTASISLTAEHGYASTLIALVAAVAVNFIVMLSSSWIGNILKYLHIIGPIIRISGLIVSAVAVQMCLNGMMTWLEKLFAK